MLSQRAKQMLLGWDETQGAPIIAGTPEAARQRGRRREVEQVVGRVGPVAIVLNVHSLSLEENKKIMKHKALSKLTTAWGTLSFVNVLLNR